MTVRLLIAPAVLMISIILPAGDAGATPSSTFWTDCTMDFQPFRQWHVTYDNYTTIGRKARPGAASSSPTTLA